MEARVRQSIGTLALAFSCLAVGLAACDDDPVSPPGESFSLTIEGDASFQEPHDGDAIHVFVEDADGEEVASEAGSVAGSEEPTFSFTFEEVLARGRDYTVTYWIDSRSDGTEGECDPDVDYVAQLEITGVSGDVSETVNFDDGATVSCDPVAAGHVGPLGSS
jgi:hypothetical protein